MNGHAEKQAAYRGLFLKHTTLWAGNRKHNAERTCPVSGK